MFYDTIKVLDNTNATLTAYIPSISSEIDENLKYEAVIVCPGGGYSFCSEREGEPIALAFLGEGRAAFVLNYSTAPEKDIYPNALLELSKAVSILREKSEEWHIDTEKIYVIGFSAGGHLAGSLATMWHEDFIAKTLNIPEGANKPNGAILAYPVISANEEIYHKGSFVNLLGEKYNQEMCEYMSLENRVSDKTPPMFLWHTGQDEAVNVRNSLDFATACQKNAVPCELHVFPFGSHGFSLGDTRSTRKQNLGLNQEHASKWFKLCIEWLDMLAKR